jgi:hypothetical protein
MPHLHPDLPALARIDTPALVIDEAALQSNIERMAKTMSRFVPMPRLTSPPRLRGDSSRPVPSASPAPRSSKRRRSPRPASPAYW